MSFVDNCTVCNCLLICLVLLTLDTDAVFSLRLLFNSLIFSFNFLAKSLWSDLFTLGSLQILIFFGLIIQVFVLLLTLFLRLYFSYILRITWVDILFVRKIFRISTTAIVFRHIVTWNKFPFRCLISAWGIFSESVESSPSSLWVYLMSSFCRSVLKKYLLLKFLP